MLDSQWLVRLSRCGANAGAAHPFNRLSGVSDDNDRLPVALLTPAAAGAGFISEVDQLHTLQHTPLRNQGLPILFGFRPHMQIPPCHQYTRLVPFSGGGLSRIGYKSLFYVKEASLFAHSKNRVPEQFDLGDFSGPDQTEQRQNRAITWRLNSVTNSA